MLRGLLNTIPPNYDHLFILTYGELLHQNAREIGAPSDKLIIINLKHKLRSSFLIMWALSTSRSIIWGGGTCFNSKENSYGGIRYMKLFHFWGAKVYYVGVGVNTDCITDLLVKNIRKAIAISENFTVRDKLSLSLIKEKIDPLFNSIVPDLVFLAGLPKRKKKGSKRYLLISYRCIDSYFYNASYFREAFINNISIFLCNEKIEKVYIYPIDQKVDYYDNRYIADKLLSEKMCLGTDIEFIDSLSIEKTINLINKASFVITGRLHVGIVSALLRVPFLLLNYSSKNRAFVKDYHINDNVLVDYNELCVDTLFLKKYQTLCETIMISHHFYPHTNNLVKDLTMVF